MGRLCTDWDRGATGYTWIEYFPNIPPASGARSNLGEMRDLAPGARSNLGEILDLAPGAWSNLGEIRGLHRVRGRILEKCDTSPLLQGHETILNAWLKAFDAYVRVTFAFQIFL